MTKILTVADIDEQSAHAVTFEQYGDKQTIDGVRVVEVKNFVTEDGYFMELARMWQGTMDAFKEEGFEVKQVNFSQSAHGSVKAWHLHFNQEDVWFITPESKGLVGLVDVRKDSPTRGAQMRVVMGEGKTQLLYIPRGVAHGYKNLKHASPLYVMYFVNNQFSLTDLDERRLPWDHFGADFWEVKKG